MSKVWEPHPYQVEGVKFVMEHANCGIFLDPGMGKTSVSLTAIKVLIKRQAVSRVLVIAPIRPMYKVWPDEIRKWTHTSDLTYTILHGDEKLDRMKKPSDIYLLNPEAVKWFLENDGIRKTGVDMLVVDESTKFKDPSTARFKLIKPHLGAFKRRVILTGSPAPNGLMDLFGQCFVMDRGASLGKYITHYRAMYFYQKPYDDYGYYLQLGADERIYERIKPSVMRMSAEDHLDMPELIPDDIFVDLDAKTMALYKQLDDEFIAILGDAVVMAPNAAVVGGKLRQIANGGLYDSEHFGHHIHDIKTQALVDLVDQLQGTPLLVGYEFQHDLDRIRRVFPNAPSFTGVTGAKLDKLVDDFNAGIIPVALAHPASAGHGLNLQESCYHICFYGLTWDLELYQQLIKRIWRQGQPSNRVFLHRILATKTRDIDVAQILLEKDATQERLFTALRRAA